jgi:hypothetical protein
LGNIIARVHNSNKITDLSSSGNYNELSKDPAAITDRKVCNALRKYKIEASHHTTADNHTYMFHTNTEELSPL